MCVRASFAIVSQPLVELLLSANAYDTRYSIRYGTLHSRLNQVQTKINHKLAYGVAVAAI